MGSRAFRIAVRLVAALALVAPSLGPDPPRARASSGPCGELQSLPGPGRYTGGLKGTLVRTFSTTATEIALPIEGKLDLDIDEGGRVTGAASMALSQPPSSGLLPISASFDLSVPFDGQLPDPIDTADVAGKATVQASVGGAIGERLVSWNGSPNLHLLGFQRNLCAAIQGAWSLEGSNDSEASRWSVRDTAWAARLADFDENLEREVRGTVAELMAMPAGAALGLSGPPSTAEADGLIDAMVVGAAALPSGGLFGLYEKVRTAPAPAAQIRCLTDLIQTAIAGKVQEYLAAGGGPTYEEAARYGYGLRLGAGLGSGPTCPAFATGLAILASILEPSLNDAMAAGADLERVARLTREARLYGFEDLAKRGGDWLRQRGYAL